MYNFVKFRTKIIIFRKSGKNRIFGQNFDFQNMDFRPKYRFLSRKFREIGSTKNSRQLWPINLPINPSFVQI